MLRLVFQDTEGGNGGFSFSCGGPDLPRFEDGFSSFVVRPSASNLLEVSVLTRWEVARREKGCAAAAQHLFPVFCPWSCFFGSDLFFLSARTADSERVVWGCASNASA